MTTGPGRNIVVIAASAGGVEALRALLPLLPPDLPASVLIVLHVPAVGGRALPAILGRAAHVPATSAVDGEQLVAAHVYVAPPDRHMLVLDGTIRLTRGPRANGHRPAADPLFFSAALSAGPRTLAVVLSGTLDDAAAGSAAVERHGGLVVIQDPTESAYPGMPEAALAVTHHATVLPLSGIAAFIDRESRIPAPDLAPTADPTLRQQLRLYLAPGQEPAVVAPGDWIGVACPDCGGPLHSDGASYPVEFECPSGHTWSGSALLGNQADGTQQALWGAVHQLEERGKLCQALADEADKRGDRTAANSFRMDAQRAQTAARTVRWAIGSTQLTRGEQAITGYPD